MHCIPFVCSALAHALLSYMCPMGPWAGHGMVTGRAKCHSPRHGTARCMAKSAIVVLRFAKLVSSKCH
eukprot:5205605-Prymnesium_polylepis.1